MDERHIRREHYEALDRGELDQDWIDDRFRQHARALCTTCEAEYLAYAVGRGRRPFEAGVLMVVLATILDGIQRLEQEAERDLQELRRTPAAHQQQRVSRAKKRFRSPLLADRLVTESRRLVFTDPDGAERFARLAFHVALQSNRRILGADPVPELLVRALAHQANAQRVRGDLVRAGKAMDQALERLDEIRNPRVRAEISSLAASLRRGQRRFPEAMALISRAIRIHQRTNERHLAGETLIVKSHVFHAMGNVQQAMKAVRQSLEHLEPTRDPRLVLCAEHMLTTYLTELGAFGHARQRLQQTSELYACFPGETTIQLRRRWVEARVARGLGEEAAAEAAFLDTRDGFLALANGYDAALVSLELALLYADQDRTAEIRELARAMVPVFRAQNVHREALAALALFVEAAGAEAVTEQLVTRLRDYLVEARDDPSQRFE